MSIFTDMANKARQIADSAYHYILPKSAGEYAKDGSKAVGRLLKDLVIDSLSTIKVVFKSFFKGLPAGIRSFGSAVKGLFWDLPKAAYYKYQQNEAEKNAALQQASEDLCYAGNQLVEAVSTGASTAYEGLKPIAIEAVSSIAYNGGEAVLDTGAVATIAFIETGKAVSNYVIPASAQLATKVGQVIHTLETLAVEQASLAYQALPSLTLLPKFTSESSKSMIPVEIEMSVMNALRAAASAA